jgi:tetratricopeptide (TPR) repeat protein
LKRSVVCMRMTYFAVLLVFTGACAGPEITSALSEDPASTRVGGLRTEAVLHLLAAKRAERGGRRDEAVTRWSAAVAIDSVSPALRLGLAKAYAAKNNDSLALLHGVATIRLDSVFTDGHRFLADLYQRRNNATLAAYHLEAAFNATYDPETGWQLARLYARLAKPDESKRVCQLMADAPSSRPDDLLAWGDLAQRLPVKGTADLFYLAYIRRWADSEDGVIAYGEFLGRSGRRAEADHLFRAWLDTHRGGREVPRQYIQLLLAQEKWTEADSVWLRTPIETPDDLIERKGWTSYLTKRGQIPLALINAARLVAADSTDGEAYVLLGQAYSAQGESDRAIRAYAEAVRRDSSLEALGEMVYALAGQRRFSEAEHASRVALGRFPGDQRLLSLWSASLLAQKKWREAARVLETLAAADSTNTDHLFDLGSSLERAGEFDSSVTVFRRVLQLDPHHADALNYLGFMFADRNIRLDEAFALLTDALKIKPRNAAYLDSMGWLLFRQGRLAEAKQHLADALQMDESVPEIHEHLGDVCSAMGEREEARAHYGRALELEPGNQQIQRKLRRIPR